MFFEFFCFSLAAIIFSRADIVFIFSGVQSASGRDTPMFAPAEGARLPPQVVAPPQPPLSVPVSQPPTHNLRPAPIAPISDDMDGDLDRGIREKYDQPTMRDGVRDIASKVALDSFNGIDHEFHLKHKFDNIATKWAEMVAHEEGPSGVVLVRNHGYLHATTATFDDGTKTKKPRGLHFVIPGPLIWAPEKEVRPTIYFQRLPVEGRSKILVGYLVAEYEWNYDVLKDLLEPFGMAQKPASELVMIIACSSSFQHTQERTNSNFALKLSTNVQKTHILHVSAVERDFAVHESEPTTFASSHLTPKQEPVQEKSLCNVM